MQGWSSVCVRGTHAGHSLFYLVMMYSTMTVSSDVIRLAGAVLTAPSAGAGIWFP